MTLTAVTNYSNIYGFTGSNIENAKVTVFGGVAGDECTAPTNTSTCNNCATSTTGGCNENRIYDNLQISFTFKGTKRGFPRIALDPQSTGTSATTITPPTPPTIVEATNVATVTVTWKSLCDAIAGSATTCKDLGASTSTTKKLFRIGIDVPTNAADPNSTGDGLLDATSDEYITVYVGVYDGLAGATTANVDACTASAAGVSNQGICNFEVFPGDKKITLVNSYYPTSFPTTPNQINYEKLRVFYAQGDAPTTAEFAAPGFTPCSFAGNKFSTLALNSPHEDLLISSPGAGSASLTTTQVKGLENGKAFYFRTATVDQAGNVVSTTKTDGPTDCTCYDTASSVCHFAIPSQVLGLASDEFDCFIASAVYDSPLAPEVKVLREFRNKILKTNWLGRKLVKFYYQNSPPLAHWLNAHKYLKNNFKYLFWPLVLWAKCCVKFGFFTTQLFLGLILLLALLLNKALSTRKKLWIIVVAFILVAPSPRLAHADDLIFGDDEPQEIQKDPNYEPEQNKEEAPPLEPPYTKHTQPSPSGNITKPIAIEEDGTHFYKIDTPPENRNWFFKVGMYGPFNVVNPSINKSYSQVYTDKPQPVLVMEYEWKLIKWLGDFGLKVGTGISFADGNGQFVDEINKALTPKETFKFMIFPNTAVLTYHFRASDTPWFVPYVQGGGGYYTFWERRSDGDKNSFGGTPVMTAGGGLLISVNRFDSDSAITLARDYGINRFWIDLHFDRVQAFNSKKDFSANMFTAGIGMGF